LEQVQHFNQWHAQYAQRQAEERTLKRRDSAPCILVNLGIDDFLNSNLVTSKELMSASKHLNRIFALKDLRRPDACYSNLNIMFSESERSEKVQEF
jgi:hypothetical protein